MNQPKEKPVHILVVDDEEIILELMSKILSDQGYEVETAKSAAEAVHKLESREFNLVITDVVMPKIDGLQLLDMVREIQPSARTIVMTGHSSTETIKTAFNRKASGFLVKPFKSVRQVVTKDERVLFLKDLHQ